MCKMFDTQNRKAGRRFRQVVFSGNNLASSPIPDHSRAAAHRLILGQYTKKNLLTWHWAREEGEVGINPWSHCHQGICLGDSARP